MYRCALIMDKINIFYSILRWVVSAILGWSSIAELFDWSTTCKQPKQLYCNLQRDRVRDVDRHILDVSQMSNLCIQHSPFGIYQPILVFILNKSHKWVYIFVSEQNDCEKHMSTMLKQSQLKEYEIWNGHCFIYGTFYSPLYKLILQNFAECTHPPPANPRIELRTQNSEIIY